MKTMKKKYRFSAGFLAVLLAICMGAATPPLRSYAAGGAIYTCVIHPSYTHPVTGVIEDSGGEAGYATGQGMVESIIYPTGILEVTDSGEYYLTIRMSMMDYTSSHSFWVQNVGDSGWSNPAIGVTGNGSDNNGTTADICIQVPSENTVVRGAMNVSAMGRDVIFYLYPSDYTQGNNTDMNATMVTASSGNESSSETQTNGENQTAQSGQSTATSDSNAALPSANSSSGNSETEEQDQTEEGESTASELESSIEQAAAPQTSESEEGLNEAQGLSLSTAEETTVETETVGTTGTRVFLIASAVTVSGLVLMGAAAGLIYLFRRNWRRWGGGEDDDE